MPGSIRLLAVVVLLFGFAMSVPPGRAFAANGVSKSNVASVGGAVVVEVRGSSVAHGKVQWRKTGARAIQVEVPQYFVVERLEDVGKDGVIELWGIQGSPEELYLDLYQIDLRDLRAVKMGQFFEAKSSLTVLASEREPFRSVRFQDIDGDGEVEMTVKTPTPTQGTPYEAGAVEWEDIYKLDPWPRVVNERYRAFFEQKRREIESEIARVQKNRSEYDERAQQEKDVGDQVRFKVLAYGAREQINAYRDWLKGIAKILGNSKSK